MVVDDFMLDGNVYFIDGACLVDVCMLGAWVLICGCICFMSMYMAASLMDECVFNGNVYGFLDECMLDGRACSVDGYMQSGCACLISPLQKYSIGLP